LSAGVADARSNGGGARDVIVRVAARGISKAFGATAALRGVDVTLERGQVTLIEGANGSGKSTLLGVLGTMVRPSGGAVSYTFEGGDERVLRGLRQASQLGSDDMVSVRAALGWLSHETLAYPDLTGRQNVELAARLHGMSAGEAWASAEERFQLGAFARRALRTCSRGQRQRVALARALVHGPSLLLLDEPTTGLDRQGVDRLLDVVREESARGVAIAVVSHDPEVFGELARRRLVLDRGREAAATGA
jgi:ABC-type multidrug transport system ATPase subunit